MSNKQQRSRIDGRYWIIPNPWDTLCFFCPLPDCKGDKHPMCPINRGKATLKAQSKKADKLVFINQYKTALQTGAERR